jgi:predicted alpha-1,2-mannosidase
VIEQTFTLNPVTGPAHVPAGKPEQGLDPSPVWEYRITGAAAGSVLLARLPLATKLVGAADVLEYAVFPVLDRSRDDIRDAYDATAVIVDLVFEDSARLSDLAPHDQHGVRHDPQAQYSSKTVAADQWTFKRIALGAAAGRRIRHAEVRIAVPPSHDGHTDLTGYVNAVAVRPAPEPPHDLLDRVRTTRGTHSTFEYSRGNTVPLVAVPHGGVFGAPMTDAASVSWTYTYAAHDRDDGRPALQAFATSHIPSPWIRDRAVFQLFPALDARPELDRSARALGFDHASESDRPHRYSVVLDGGIHAELTAARFSLVLRVRYPADHGSLIFDQADGGGGLRLPEPAPAGAVVRAFVDGADESPRMFVHATLDRPVLAARAEGTRGSVHLDLGPDRTVTVRLGTSFLSTEQARKNLAEDLGEDSFDAVAARAHDAWAARLGQIQVEGGSDDQLTTLYSNLYRLFLYPNEAAENTQAGPRYASPFPPMAKPHTADETGCRVVAGRLSVNHGFWDTYRTVWPALTLLRPADAGRLLDGFLQHYRDGGWTSRWSAPGPIDNMTGTTTDVIFADALVADLPDLDPLTAYDSALHNATVTAPVPLVGRKGVVSQKFRGFTDTTVSEGMSWTLDAAINDSGIAKMARSLAEKLPAEHRRQSELAADAEYYAARAARYATVFDRRIGFFQGRDPDGGWRIPDPQDYDPRLWGEDYTETNGWGTAFTAPHDGAGLTTLHGGKAALERALDEFFATQETGRPEVKGSYSITIHEMAEARDVRMGMFGMSNQPAHHIPFMYAFTGAHHKTQRIVREVLRRLFLGSEIGQGYPGDEDNGEMSAWYVLAALGLYPLVPASDEFVLTTPLFPRTEVQLPQGKRLTVRTVGDPADDYIAAVTVDGHEWQEISIPRRRLLRGADLVVTLSPEPTSWAGDSIPASLTPPGATPRTRLDLTGPGTHPAFDDTGTTTTLLHPGEQVGYTFAQAEPTTLYTVTTARAGRFGWRLQGRESDGEWRTLDSRSAEEFRWDGQTRPFLLTETAAYASYRLVADGTLPLTQLELLAER